MPSIKHHLLQNHNGLLYFSTNSNNIILTKCNTLSFTLKPGSLYDALTRVALRALMRVTTQELNFIYIVHHHAWRNALVTCHTFTIWRKYAT